MCKQSVYDNQHREKDPATGAYRHKDPQDCKVIATGGSSSSVGGSGHMYIYIYAYTHNEKVDLC